MICENQSKAVYILEILILVYILDGLREYIYIYIYTHICHLMITFKIQDVPHMIKWLDTKAHTALLCFAEELPKPY